MWLRCVCRAAGSTCRAHSTPSGHPRSRSLHPSQRSKCADTSVLRWRWALTASSSQRQVGLRPVQMLTLRRLVLRACSTSATMPPASWSKRSTWHRQAGRTGRASCSPTCGSLALRTTGAPAEKKALGFSELMAPWRATACWAEVWLRWWASLAQGAAGARKRASLAAVNSLRSSGTVRACVQVRQLPVAKRAARACHPF
mmetsp:Transcript_86524/g.201344  ORF Transcript_86524/g.201344 Transcript_86524/m.201344 type:complete len:200 (+) Transcript_86524:689-1288(+)